MARFAQDARYARKDTAARKLWLFPRVRTATLYLLKGEHSLFVTPLNKAAAEQFFETN